MLPTGTPRPWVVMPVVAHPAYTEAAIADVLAQTVSCRLLVVNQGVETAFRQRLERIAEQWDHDVLVWTHEPPLPSLAATWNTALDCAWAAGAEVALVVNNDVRLPPNFVERLLAAQAAYDAYVVTGVGVGPGQFEPGQLLLPGEDGGRGGPDFSAFLMTKRAHTYWRFDEAFVPAYCEDLDLHRRMLLDQAGDRIFGVNLPFLHYGSTTLKTVDEKTRARIERDTQQYARAYYARKWGGSENQERYTRAFHPESEADGVTTPDLQRAAADATVT
jgi:hypothetical protein